MIRQIQEKLQELLNEQGVMDVVLDAGGLTEYRGKRFAVVLPGRERIEDGKGRIVLDENPDGTRTFTREVLVREVPVQVYCFDMDIQRLENTVIGVLTNLRNGIKIEGTWIQILDRALEWELPHSQLRDVQMVQLTITFRVPVLVQNSIGKLTMKCGGVNG